MSRTPRLTRLLRTVFTVATLGALAGLAVVPSAEAAPTTNTFGSTKCVGSPRNCVNIADNALHTWYWEGKFGNQIPGIAAAMQAAVNDYEVKTDLTTAKSARSKTLDVQVTDYNYGLTGILGWVECRPGSKTNGKDPNRTCDRQKLRLNGSYPQQFNTAAKRLSLSCHELGHTVGLRHTADVTSCMRSPFDDARFSTTLSVTDIRNINAYYPKDPKSGTTNP